VDAQAPLPTASKGLVDIKKCGMEGGLTDNYFTRRTRNLNRIRRQKNLTQHVLGINRRRDGRGSTEVRNQFTPIEWTWPLLTLLDNGYAKQKGDSSTRHRCEVGSWTPLIS
jgi:hypothetical protein